jgi:glycine cleavage system H protein
MELKEDLYYSKDHEWVKVLDGNARVGITDYAQSKLGDVVYVGLPKVGKEVKKGKSLCVLESVKAASNVYAGFDCTVVEVNERLSDEPELINRSPYDDGWIAVVEIKDKGQLKELLSAEEYKKLTE